MRKLLFLNQLALICNILFLVCLVFQRTKDIIPNQDIKGLIIILGWLLSFFLDLIVNFWAAILLLQKRLVEVPKWLLVTNLLFLFIEFIHHYIIA